MQQECIKLQIQIINKRKSNNAEIIKSKYFITGFKARCDKQNFDNIIK